MNYMERQEEIKVWTKTPHLAGKVLQHQHASGDW
jgi:hypothetical protein